MDGQVRRAFLFLESYHNKSIIKWSEIPIFIQLGAKMYISCGKTFAEDQIWISMYIVWRNSFLKFCLPKHIKAVKFSERCFGFFYRLDDSKNWNSC